MDPGFSEGGGGLTVMRGRMAMARVRVREREHGSFCYVCLTFVYFCAILHPFMAVSVQWNGLLEWTTGMPFDLTFSHKNPIGVWDSVITLLSS